MKLRTPGVGHREVFDEIIVAHLAVIVQIPSWPTRDCVDTDLGHHVQGVRGLVLFVPRLLPRRAVLFGEVPEDRAAAAVPGGTGELLDEEAGAAASSGRGGGISGAGGAAEGRGSTRRK